MHELTEREEGVLTAWHFLRVSNTTVPEKLQEEVDQILTDKPWIARMGHVLITGPVGPYG